VKRELPRLAQLAQKVVNRHGSMKSELPVIAATLMQLDEELTQHLVKEEAVLFPYIAALEQSVSTGTAKPHSCFGTVANPIAMMTQEHDAAGSLIGEIRRLSGDFTTPGDACPTFHGSYDGLRGYEQDLHQHIHLENNIPLSSRHRIGEFNPLGAPSEPRNGQFDVQTRFGRGIRSGPFGVQRVSAPFLRYNHFDDLALCLSLRRRHPNADQEAQTG
jgi:hemerythrin-like domain-containing protein